jgi:hypothetical protein
MKNDAFVQEMILECDKRLCGTENRQGFALMRFAWKDASNIAPNEE